MEKLITVVIFLFGFLQVEAQQLTVVGSDSSLPVKGVSISNKDKSIIVYTDKDGNIDMSVFVKEHAVFLYHHLFVKKKCVISDLKSAQYSVTIDRVTEALEEVVVSVTRTKEKKNRIAEQIEVISSREIKKIAPQSSADLLAKTPGIKVQKSQFGGGSPVLRGMEANRVLLVVDGVRMNNAIYRKGHLQNGITVSPSILDRVEVLFGPSSVIYGSDALGGVIHYYTKSLKTAEFNEVKSSVYSRVSSINDEFTTHVDTELSFQKWASYTSVSYSSFGDLKMGKNRTHGYEDWGKVYRYSDNSETIANEESIVNSDPNTQINTGFSQIDLLQKIYIPVSNDIELLFNFQYSKSSDIPRFDRLTELTTDSEGLDVLKFAEWSYGPQKRLLLSTQLMLSEVHKWIDRGTITLAYQDIGESRIQRKFSAINERSYRNEDVDVFSLNADFSVALTEAKNRNLSYGFEIIYNKVNSSSKGEYLDIDDSTNQIKGILGNYPVQSRYPDGGSDYATQAIYAEYRQDLNRKNTLNTGIRFTNTHLNAIWLDNPDSILEKVIPDAPISLQNNALTATIGHVYKPTELLKLSAVLSSGFRSPNVDDIGKIREKGGYVTVPNTQLDPEFAYNSEIGILHYFNNKRFSAGLNVYYTLLNNYIIRAPYDVNAQAEGDFEIEYNGETAKVLANVNRGKAYVTGGSFHFRGELSEHWFTRGAVTFTEGKTYDTTEYMSSIPPLFGNLGFTYRIEKFDFDFEYEFNTAKKSEKYNLFEGIDNIDQTPLVEENAVSDIDKYAGTPAWDVFNFSVFYEINNTLEIQLKTTNILDKHYKEFASGISAPGRSFSTSVRYMF
tara:strand:+ start:38544 stop:41063 length:2520 start_codon:yes stop_codon:yes gene_type:complete